MIFSILPIIGSILGLVLELEQLTTNYVLAFVLGILFYMIVRDVIPHGIRKDLLGSLFCTI